MDLSKSSRKFHGIICGFVGQLISKYSWSVENRVISIQFFVCLFSVELCPTNYMFSQQTFCMELSTFCHWTKNPSSRCFFLSCDRKDVPRNVHKCENTNHHLTNIECYLMHVHDSIEPTLSSVQCFHLKIWCHKSNLIHRFCGEMAKDRYRFTSGVFLYAIAFSDGRLIHCNTVYWHLNL